MDQERALKSVLTWGLMGLWAVVNLSSLLGKGRPVGGLLCSGEGGSRGELASNRWPVGYRSGQTGQTVNLLAKPS